jgi:GntR family transcriptional regulator
VTAKTGTKPVKKRPQVPQFFSDEVPLYYQLASLLREKIITGQYAPDEQLPTEADLVNEYSLSRITVRQALGSLEEEGLIRREPGRGTFVTEMRPFAGKLAMDGSIDDLISMGLATSVKLLDLRSVAAGPEDAALLDLEPGSRLTRVTRVRLYHQEPYSYIVNYLPREIGEKLTRTYLKRGGGVLKFIEEEMGLHLRDAEQSVKASLADASLARALNTRIGAPLLFVDRVVRCDDGRPVERVHVFYRSDIFSFTVHLTRDPKRDKHAATGWAFKERKTKRTKS